MTAQYNTKIAEIVLDHFSKQSNKKWIKCNHCPARWIIKNGIEDLVPHFQAVHEAHLEVL